MFLFFLNFHFQLEAKNKARQAEVDKGNEDELSEFEIKKQEKEKHVEELRAKLSDLKAKEEEKRGERNHKIRCFVSLNNKIIIPHNHSQ